MRSPVSSIRQALQYGRVIIVRNRCCRNFRDEKSRAETRECGDFNVFSASFT